MPPSPRPGTSHGCVVQADWCLVSAQARPGCRPRSAGASHPQSHRFWGPAFPWPEAARWCWVPSSSRPAASHLAPAASLQLLALRRCGFCRGWGGLHGLIALGEAAAAAAPRAAWWRCWSSHEREIRQSTAESPRALAPAAPSRAVPRRGLAGSSRSAAGCLHKRPSGVLWPWAISSATVAWLAPAAASRTACRASRCCSAVPKIRNGPSCPRWGTSTATPTSRLSSNSTQPPDPNILPRSPASRNISSQLRPPRP